MSLSFISERTFDVNGLTFTAKEWGSPGYTPVIALHGWLDNAASFDLMLPFMSDMHVIALDCAGHGGSSFRSADSGYNIWQDIAEVLGVADQMGWDRFALLGHSRGAIISTLIAGAFPARISHAALIDGYLPGLADAKGTAIQLAKSVYEAKRFSASTPSFFPDFDRAVQARVNGFISLSEGAATVLAQRGVREHERGFYWHTDQRLKAASQLKLTRDHMKDFFTSITAPVMLIQAEDSGFKPDAQQDETFAWVTNLRLLKMPGSHHLHMEEQAQQVAEEVQKFILPA
tara:strand:+ start:65 stop:928 length:864 start_codon:yes stop_codon:yes gene_type:complete